MWWGGTRETSLKQRPFIWILRFLSTIFLSILDASPLLLIFFIFTQRRRQRELRRGCCWRGLNLHFTVNPSYVVHVYIYRSDRDGFVFFFFFGGHWRKYNNIIGILERQFWNRSGSIRCQTPAGQGKNVGPQKDG